MPLDETVKEPYMDDCNLSDEQLLNELCFNMYCGIGNDCETSEACKIRKVRERLKALRQATEKVELKSCPFCGSTDIRIIEKCYNGGAVTVKGHKFWRVECLPCDARTGDCFDGDHNGNGLQAAVDAWNRRPGNDNA
jgi:Lar family restriction alleviation protein